MNKAFPVLALLAASSAFAATDGVKWSASEWISVAGAPVAGETEKKRHRAADGTSVFWHRHVNAKAVKSAKWTATGLGVFELYVNGGDPLGTDFLKPGFTHFAKTKRSFSYDITSRLRTGAGEANDFGAEVSAGWWRDKVCDYAGRKSAFRGVVELTYVDGTDEIVGTKASEWQGRLAGPVLHAGIFDGEEFDAREDNAARKPPTPFKPGGCERNEEFRGEILPSDGAEVVLREDLTEERDMIRRNLVVRPGQAVVVDFGQNCAAVPSFEFRAKRGTVLTALPGEMLNDADKGRHGCDGPKGSVYRANLRIPDDGMRIVYAFAGDGWEKYRPRFTYFGYRYVAITATDEVEIRCVKSIPVTSITKAMETGRIETGVADLNQFFTNVYWTQLSNFLSVPTDCPQRNERLGWGADAWIYSEAGSYVADTGRFYRKWTRDLRDGRCRDGGYPSAAPQGPWGKETFNFGWADAGVIVPWTVWTMFGDRTILEENYEAMAKFVRKLDETKYDFEDTLDYIWADWLSCETFESCGNAYGNFYGKWKHDPDAKNYRLFLAACHWLNDARMMALMAEASGRADDAAWFRESTERALVHIRSRFLEPDGLLLKPMRHLQTACVFALKFGIVGGAAKTATLALLVKSVRDHGNFMLTGILGTRHLLDALAACGETELCYTLLLQRGNPSWLHSVGHGATTVWERCDGYTAERGFGPVTMNSFNHYAFGAVIGWAYRTAAGIAADPAKPGFKSIVMAPKPDRRLGYVKAEYRSRAGLVKSAWRYEGSRWIWDFTVPEGASASVTLPGESETRTYSAGTYRIDRPSRPDGIGTRIHPSDLGDVGEPVFELRRRIDVAPCENPLSVAREKVRALRAGGVSGEVEVVFAPGEYAVTETAAFGTDDSGAPDAKVTYRAARPGTVVFSGGRRIEPSAFRRVTDEATRARLPPEARSRVLVADVSGLLPPLAPWPDRVSAPPAPWLYADGEPLEIARWPNKTNPRGNWARFETACKTGAPEGHRKGNYSPKMTPGSFYCPDARADRWDVSSGVWLFGYWTHDWAYDILRVADVSATPTNRIVALAAPHGYGIGVGTWGAKERRYYAVNLLEELDAPGEWWLDRVKRQLYLVPPADFERLDLRLAVLDKPFAVLDGVHDLEFRDVDFAYSHAPGVALELRGDCQRVVFDGCGVRCIGGAGVELNGRANAFRNGKVLQAGAGGVRLRGGDRKTLTRADNTVANTEIGFYGRFVRTYAAGVDIQGVGQTVRGCRIHDAPHNAILYGGNENLIASNEIFRVLLETGDAGAIYTGRDASTLGNVIEGNHFHDLGGDEELMHCTMGVYFDDCDWGDAVIGNVFERLGTAVFIGGGNLHPVVGNTMRDCAVGVHVDARGVTWQKTRGGFLPNAQGESWQAQKLKPFVPFAGAWRERYPELMALLADRPELPRQNPVSNNVFIACKGVFSLDALSQAVTNECPFADNRIFATVPEASTPRGAVTDRTKGFCRKSAHETQPNKEATR